tara:strand:- start:8417 stop:8644 length:228 start_codon:yes stop_codon:yes gene_type:complete
MKKGVNHMGKVKSHEHLINERLLDREEDIRVLKEQNRQQKAEIAELRLALLKIQSTGDYVNNLYDDLIKKALNYG